MTTARLHPSVAAVKSALDSGRLGAPALVRLHRWRPQHEVAPSLEDRLAVDLDLALWLFGAWPISLMAMGTPHDESLREATASRYVQVHLAFADEGMALVDLALTLPAGAGYFSLSVIGVRGAAYADDHANTQLAFLGGPAQAILAQPLDTPDALEAGELPRRLAPLLAAVRESLLSRLPIALAGGPYDAS